MRARVLTGAYLCLLERSEGRRAAGRIDREIELALSVVEHVCPADNDVGVPDARDGDLVTAQQPPAVAAWARVEQVLAQVRPRQPNADPLRAGRVGQVEAQ